MDAHAAHVIHRPFVRWRLVDRCEQWFCRSEPKGEMMIAPKRACEQRRLQHATRSHSSVDSLGTSLNLAVVSAFSWEVFARDIERTQSTHPARQSNTQATRDNRYPRQDKRQETERALSGVLSSRVSSLAGSRTMARVRHGLLASGAVGRSRRRPATCLSARLQLFSRVGASRPSFSFTRGRQVLLRAVEVTGRDKGGRVVIFVGGPPSSEYPLSIAKRCVAQVVAGVCVPALCNASEGLSATYNRVILR